MISHSFQDPAFVCSERPVKLRPRSVPAAGIEIATVKSGFGKFGMSGIVLSQNPRFPWNAANLTTAGFDASNEQFTVVSNSGNDAVFISTTAEPFPYIFFTAPNPFSTYIGQSSIPLDLLRSKTTKTTQALCLRASLCRNRWVLPHLSLSLRASF